MTHHKTMYEQCKEHIHSYVLIEVNDGSQIDGIITGVDDEYVYLAIPIDHSQESMQHHQRIFWAGYGGFGYPTYGRPRRFTRLILPLVALTAISALPWY